MDSSTASVGAPLKLPCRFKGILNGTRVATGQVSDNHHVLDEARRDAEGCGKLPQQRVTVVEIGADDHVLVVKLPYDQPAVISPFGQSLPHAAAYARQGLGQATYVVHVH
jgi:hypothetical protein